MPRKKLPKFMMVYLCPHCGFDSGMSEQEKPHCFACEATEGLQLIEKTPISREAIAARLKRCNDRTMDALRAAYNIGKEEMSDEEFDEMLLLKVLEKGQQLEKITEKLDSSSRP